MAKQNVLAGLVPSFGNRVKSLLDCCQETGFRVVPYQGWRSSEDQARLWRQSRSLTVIHERIAALRAAGANHIAGLIERVGPQHGPHVTDALPGQSWHQFGRAVDCWIKNPETGRELWRDRRMDEAEFGAATKLYQRFGQTAESLGLTWGGRWALGDYGHVQMDRVSSPLAMFGSWAALDRALADQTRSS